MNNRPFPRAGTPGKNVSSDSSAHRSFWSSFSYFAKAGPADTIRGLVFIGLTS